VDDGGDQTLDGSFHSWISMWVAGNACHSERFRDKYTYDKALYICPVLIFVLQRCKNSGVEINGHWLP